MRYLIKNGFVVTSKETTQMDLLIEEEKIKRIAPTIEAEESMEVIDAKGNYIFPGFIDAHTHFDLEVAGTVTADDFSSGTKAAIAGGNTCIIDFATQNKGETLEEASEHWHKKADGKSSCDYGFHMAVTDWNQQTKDDLKAMFEEGITSFKLYMTYDTKVSDGEIFEILTELKKYGGIVGVHCENGAIIDELVKKQKENGNFSPSAHPLTRPAEVEAEAVNRLLYIAKLVDIPIVVVHLSSKLGFKEAEQAIEQGQTVFLETCPQYLLMDDSKYQLDGFESAKYVCSPPLRKKEDADCLWKALKENKLHTISTDHCSFNFTQKEMGKEDFTKIPNGMPGVQHRAELLYTYGVLEEKITVSQMCKYLAENPARLYGLYPKKGCIKEGSDADLVIWNGNASETVTKENQLYHMDYSPLEGVEIKGKPDKVFLRGQMVVDHGCVIKENCGLYVKRSTMENEIL
ncbi:dihydropyrimidinase [Velocimicrobium porci]|uniref:Dihydropyrimidinase n=1 Tax=Velocimicrobium porci TaxID=2606634 RepID=A0A6L5Y160_9FIRM|nr:dihydropyrimidinase [Velocimicrobium porci]MSS63893.1 dihydropyrimidinase [Velocimicrobium porci]